MNDPEEMGECDTCGVPYELASRDGRCGDCGDCSECCEDNINKHVRTFREDEVLEMLTHTWQLLLVNADQEAFNYLDIMIKGIKGGEL